MLNLILLFSLLTFSVGAYTHNEDKTREFQCRFLEKLFHKYKNTDINSFSSGQQKWGWAQWDWYRQNCPSKYNGHS